MYHSFLFFKIQVDNKFLSNLLEEKEQNGNEEVVIRFCAKGDLFCIKVELDEDVIDLISSEFSLLDSQALAVIKLPYILIRNDRDVNRLKNGEQVEFYIVNDQIT